MDKYLTVIIPVYNDETNISRCLDSIFNQTIKDIDIIVVNDASTDGTLERLFAIQKEHEFKIIDMPMNSGAGSCRNAGIHAAKTPYITFMDSDDWLDISTYEKCAEQLFDNPDVINFGLYYDYVNVNHRQKKYNYPHIYRMTGEFALNIYTHTIPNEIDITPIVNNKIYRKQFLTDNNIAFHPNIRYQEDDIFTFEVLTKANSVIFVDNCNYHYCQREDSLIHSVSECSISSFVKAYKTLETYLISNALYDKYKTSFYLKFKSSLCGVIKRTIDYEPNSTIRNNLMCILLTSLIEQFDILELANVVNFSKIRQLLQ